jgi:tRNA threonylcarbamoyladenosine biosynthesis protein TsaE
LPAFIVSSSEEETIALGKRIALSLEEGAVVALRGTLGAGKTCLAKGIALGIGITDEITSPSYAIICEYKGPVPFYHVDAYRLGGNDDFRAIGGEEVIYGKGISVIEWSERVSDFIPPQALRIDFEITGENSRSIHIYKRIY